MIEISKNDFEQDFKFLKREKNKGNKFYYCGLAAVLAGYFVCVFSVLSVSTFLDFFWASVIWTVVVVLVYTKVFDYYWDIDKPLSPKEVAYLRKKMSESSLELIARLYVKVDDSKFLTRATIHSLFWSYTLLEAVLQKQIRSNEQAVILGQEPLRVFEYHISNEKVRVIF